MTRQRDAQEVASLMLRAMEFAGGDRRRAGRMLISAFKGALKDDRIWASEVLLNEGAELAGLVEAVH